MNTLSKTATRKGKLIEGKYTEEHLIATAISIVSKKTANSRILDEEAEALVPKFDESEIKLGRVLGRGGFCVVNEITKVILLRKEEEDRSKNSGGYIDETAMRDVIQDRSFIQSHCLRGKGKDCRYAFKKLQDSCYNDASTFINGMVDLAVEARFLAILRHANIIKMRAVSTCSPYDSDFFVVLDRLYDTLTTRLIKWEKQKPAGIKKLLDRGGKKESAFWAERCGFAYDLACALKFLHQSNVMYRDIKPDNIGFDVRGDIKIFDFGLAREFDPKLRDADGFFKLTGDTGSPRYMDPMVALGRPYNERCDVYSFCILLWEMLELEVPFDGFNMNMLTKHVVHGGVRPIINPKLSPEMQDMMRSGFGNIFNRNTMAEVCEVLRVELCRYTGREVQEFTDASHRGDVSKREGTMNKSVMSARAVTAK